MKYDNMIPKIAKYSSLIIFIVQFFFVQSYPKAQLIYECLSQDYVIVWQGLSFSAVMIILPLVWYFFEEHIRLHNKIASLFRLREKYDYFIIVREFFVRLDIEEDRKKAKLNTKRILDKVFYPYMGFYVDPPLDEHLLSEVQRKLQFYWIMQNALFVTIGFTAIGIIISLSFNSFQLLLIVVFGITLVSIKGLIGVSKEEVSVILNNQERSEDVKIILEEIMDAL